MPSQLRIGMLLLVCLAVAASGWIAWAQVGAGGVISGCLSPSGFIRGIDDTTGSCRTGDQALSWYTKAGTDAAFLSSAGADARYLLKTGKAADADLLDGLDSTAFLSSGTSAGGALTGTYPNPAIAAGAVGTAAIQNGAVTAAKLDPSLNLSSRIHASNMQIQVPPCAPGVLCPPVVQTLVEVPGLIRFTGACSQTPQGDSVANLGGQDLSSSGTNIEVWKTSLILNIFSLQHGNSSSDLSLLGNATTRVTAPLSNIQLMVGHIAIGASIVTYSAGVTVDSSFCTYSLQVIVGG